MKTSSRWLLRDIEPDDLKAEMRCLGPCHPMAGASWREATERPLATGLLLGPANGSSSAKSGPRGPRVFSPVVVPQAQP